MKAIFFSNSNLLISLIVLITYQFYFQNEINAQSLKLGASDITDTYVDEIIIAFDPNASFGIDAYDASKLWNSEPSIPNFYSALGPTALPYQINMLPVLDDTTIYVTLGLSVVISGDYHIKMLVEQGLPTGTEVTLIDSTLHIHTDMLSTSPDYTFYMTNNNCTGSQPQCIGRFYLKIYYPSSTPGVKTKTIQPAPYCIGHNISINYTATGTFDPANIFTAELSDANGNFGSPTFLGSIISATSGTINATIPLSTPTGLGYRIRVNSTSPSYTGIQNTTDLKIGIKPTVTYTGTIPPICENSTSINLFAIGSISPSGGNFEGIGVINNNFNPTIAGATGSPHTISYIYSDFAGCSDTAYNTIIVNPKPTVTFSGTLQDQCRNWTSYNLNNDAIVSPTGGYFSGEGINGNIFNPTQIPSSQNTATIYYVYTDANSCTDSSSNIITLNELPTVSISNYNSMYCNYDSDVVFIGSPFGGVFTINGILGNIFSPSSLGLGTHIVIYTYTDANSCSNSETVNVDVDACLTINNFKQNNKTFVYPNPVSEFFNIITNVKGDYIVKIYNTTGQKIYENYFTNNDVIKNQKINVKDFNKGIYFIKIEFENTSEEYKVLKN